MHTTTDAAGAARRFFELAEAAGKYGGFWVSVGGGTANVVAGEIARRFGVSFEEAHCLLEEAGLEWTGPDWYEVLFFACSGDRFDARLIAQAAGRH